VEEKHMPKISLYLEYTSCSYGVHPYTRHPFALCSFPAFWIILCLSFNYDQQVSQLQHKKKQLISLLEHTIQVLA